MPSTSGAILLLEDLTATFGQVDNVLTELRLAGIFDDIAALVIGAPADWAAEDAPDASADELILRCVLTAPGRRAVPAEPGGMVSRRHRRVADRRVGRGLGPQPGLVPQHGGAARPGLDQDGGRKLRVTPNSLRAPSATKPGDGLTGRARAVLS